MYTKEHFGVELKKRVAKEQDLLEIADFAYDLYLSYYYDLELNRVLFALASMAAGPEFVYSYERLNEIADDLIIGRKVKFDW